MLLVAGRSSRWHQWPTQHNVILVNYPCKLLSVHNNKSFTSKITIFDPYTGLPVTGAWGGARASGGEGAGKGVRDCKQTNNCPMVKQSSPTTVSVALVIILFLYEDTVRRKTQGE